MKLTPRAFKIGGPSLLVVALLGWYVGSWLGLVGWKLWVLRGALWLLSTVAVYLVVRLLPDRRKKDTGALKSSEIAELLRTAARRLQNSGVSGKRGLRSMPVVLFLGPGQSAKTSVIQHAGLDLDFLAGDGDQGEPPPPTPHLNSWLRLDTVFLEVGEGAWKSDEGWAELLAGIREGGWASTMKGQPLRSAVICVDCDWLRGSRGSPPAALAKELRDRLAEAAAALDTRLPVYVLFTKADQIPFFTEFVQGLKDEEAAEPLGVTLPLAEGEDPGLYSRWQTARLREAFDRLFRSVSRKRADVLAREGDLSARASAYEFPRELAKLAEPATAFLVELTKPSRLRISPFLRGFYFTGVRPVATGGRREPAVAPPVPQVPRGATMVFDPSSLAAQPAPQAQSSRRTAQWTFLQRLIPEVILRDEVAGAASVGGIRAAVRKRALAASGVAVAALLALFLTISFFGNRGLQRETRNAMLAVENVRGGGFGTPSVEDLQRLDQLRAQVARLADHEGDGSSLWLHWGLFSGKALLPPARRLYFSRFRALLFEPTRSALLSSLGDLPEEPTQDQYERKYEALKAYLITTSFPDSGTASFLTPALLGVWREGRNPDEERTELARRQFDLYAAELPFGNPYSDAVDNLVVERARAFLRQNANEQSFYAAMLSQANSQFASIQFNRDFPGSARYVVDAMEVPGAFTPGGWEFVRQGLESATDFFQRETYVVGPDFFAGLDPVGMAGTLRTRYRDEYVQTWLQFLASARVSNFGLSAAEGNLSELAGPRSPLFQMLDVASRNTVVDTTEVGPSFQPLHLVSPPDVTDRLFGESAQGYLTELGKLAGAMGQLSDDPGSSRAQEDAASAAQGAASEIDALRLGFNTAPEGAATSGAAIEALLRAPVQYARSAIGRSDVTAMEGRGQQFCRTSGSVLQRFPFSNSGSDAELDQVNALLHPGDGSVWALRDEIQGAGVALSPDFQQFLGRAEAASRALYPQGAQDPRLRFRLRGQPTDQVPLISLNIDGDEESFTRTSTLWGNFTWDAGTAQEVLLRAQVGERSDSLVHRGTWGLFKFFHQAEWQRNGDTWRLTWRLDDTGATVQADLDLLGEQPVLRRGFFDGLSCPRNFVR